MDKNEELERVVIVCDERCAELVQRMEDGLNNRPKNFVVEVIIWCQAGANISKLILAAEKRAKNLHHKYDYLYLFGGVYDLIHIQDSLANGVFDNTGDLVNELFDKFEMARHRLQKIAHRPVICRLVGVDIYTFNKGQGDMQVECQNAINWGLPHLNRAINSLNKDIDCISPWLGSSIHATIHHKVHHKYRRLKDGLLPTTDTGDLWADAFVHAILTNCAWNDK